MKDEFICDPVFYTTDQVAKILAIKPLTVHRMRWRGDGPAYVRVGGAIRYECGDLQAYIDANRHGKGDAHE